MSTAELNSPGHPVLISNLKNNHAFPETFPGNEFPGCYVPSLQDFFIA